MVFICGGAAAVTEPVITSTQNAFIKKVKSLHAKKGREQQRLFLVEGEKCVSELLAYRPEHLEVLIVEDGCHTQTAERALAMGCRVCTVSTHVMAALCDCKTPQGIAAVASFLPQPDIEGGLIVALDDVQDPQNVGAIIRTADAAGCAGIVLSPGCADCYAPKSVRASMGSLFHLPVRCEELGACAERLLKRGYSIVCADIGGEEDFSLDAEETCLVIGNESRGVSEKMLALSKHRIRIPMRGRAQSLNAAVAAGILIYKICT